METATFSARQSPARKVGAVAIAITLVVLCSFCAQFYWDPVRGESRGIPPVAMIHSPDLRIAKQAMHRGYSDAVDLLDQLCAMSSSDHPLADHAALYLEHLRARLR